MKTRRNSRPHLGRHPPDARRPALFEEFLQGEEHSFDSVAIDGRIVWYSISRYLPAPLTVLENAWIQWCVLLPREIEGPEYDEIRAAAGPALRALGLTTGMTHMEWFRRADGGIAISEVAARPPGAQFTTLISYSSNCDFYRAWPRLMVTDEFTVPRRDFSAGAAYLRGMGTGRVRAVHGLAQAQRELGSLVVEARLPQAGHAQPDRLRGRRLHDRAAPRNARRRASATPRGRIDSRGARLVLQAAPLSVVSDSAQSLRRCCDALPIYYPFGHLYNRHRSNGVEARVGRMQKYSRGCLRAGRCHSPRRTPSLSQLFSAAIRSSCTRPNVAEPGARRRGCGQLPHCTRPRSQRPEAARRRFPYA